MYTFVEAVRERRKNKNLSIEKLAELCDLSDGEISNIERGISIPRLNTVLVICDVCDIYVGQLAEISYERRGF